MAEEINSTKDAMVKNIDFGSFRVQGLAVDGGDHMQCTTELSNLTAQPDDCFVGASRDFKAAQLQSVINWSRSPCWCNTENSNP